MQFTTQAIHDIKDRTQHLGHWQSRKAIFPPTAKTSHNFTGSYFGDPIAHVVVPLPAGWRTHRGTPGQSYQQEKGGGDGSAPSSEGVRCGFVGFKPM